MILKYDQKMKECFSNYDDNVAVEDEEISSVILMMRIMMKMMMLRIGITGQEVMMKAIQRNINCEDEGFMDCDFQQEV